MPIPTDGLRLYRLGPSRHLVPWLWGLTLLFLLRVLGQVLVAFFQVPFLPPMAHWYSGLLPYPLLLPSQLLILALQVKINRDLAQGRGWFRRPHRRLGQGLQYASYGYALVMVIRYGITMSLYPERRWLGEDTIPIVFHWVLAAYLWLWGWGHRHGRQP
ncbi:hypothetical protein H6F75_24555 [Nodosilinea sp. FACHB-131]|uniref:hypothetical protein n=1 Tax=Cyanophyceae TaxID=3028117 RepID=UPI00168580AC|nr:hypothetical protein [Nodosilinea sp. FACHB-131]MBD1876664.1 hypothetical protein [Nodosilinea sp. FACHB-131]